MCLIKNTVTLIIRGVRLALFLIAMMGVSLGFNRSLDAAPKKGGKLRIAILADIGGFDSLKIPVTGRQRAFVMQAIHDNLFDIDPKTFEFIPHSFHCRRV